jgi:predicted phosphate transport protein (TIGR00153 family)
MRSIFNLFAQSPLGPLNEHMTKVRECVDKIPSMFEALYREDYDQVKLIAKEIYALEHDADLIKTKIRDNIPRNLRIPMNKQDFLNILSMQDTIADTAEDVGVLLTIRHTRVPEEMKPLLDEFLKTIFNVVDLAMKIVSELGNLEETAFGGEEAREVLKMVDDLGLAEWESDKRQYKLSQKLFELEDRESPTAILMWTFIIVTLSKIANSAEKLGKQIRGTLST